MEFTREIYWNVGRGIDVLAPMYLLTVLACGALVWGFYRRTRVYRTGKPLNRTDDLGQRFAKLWGNILTQAKVIGGSLPGLAHALFFWGFLLLFIGTCLVFIQADFTDPFLGIRFLTGNFYKLFSLVLDVAGLVAMVMLAGLFVRRYLVRASQLSSKLDDIVMHALLFAILATGFLIEGARMAVTELGTPLAAWSPVGLFVAKAMSGMAEAGLRSTHIGLWWLHLFLVAGFIVIIPLTKFRHIFTTSANYLFFDNGPVGSLTTIDLEDEAAESYGAARVTDLTWKDIFDADACTLCQRCDDRCPAHNTDKPLSPMTVVKQIGRAAFHNPEEQLIETVSKDALWACTTCRACQHSCPASIEHVGKIVEMRRNLVLMEGEFPGEEVMTAVDQVEVNGNPLGMGYAARGDWAEGLPVVTLAEDANVDILYFVGCYASFDKRNIAVARSFITLCAAAGVKVGILGKEEKCCGEPVRKMGNEYLYQSVAAENIERINNYGVRQIVTSCPHCYNTLAKDYRDFGFDVIVEHYTTYLARLLDQDRLKLAAQEFSCTYHDSCYLGRYNDIYAAPRNLINAAGGKLEEMDKSQSESFCCGGGGGRIMAEENLGERISVKRVRMAAETGSAQLVSSCPFCLTMFEDGVKGAELENNLAARDVAEILAERVVAS